MSSAEPLTALSTSKSSPKSSDVGRWLYGSGPSPEAIAVRIGNYPRKRSSPAIPAMAMSTGSGILSRHTVANVTMAMSRVGIWKMARRQRT